MSEMVDKRIIYIIGIIIQTLPTVKCDAVKPKIEKAKSLVCYQCNSSTEELEPKCDLEYFKLLQSFKKDEMRFQCPSYRSKFCFISVKKVQAFRITSRGCSSGVDVNNNALKSGCLRSKIRDEELLCFCKTNLCNSGTSIKLLYHTKKNIYVLFLILEILLFNIYIRYCHYSIF
uniref:Uncharacterized protein LOC114347342 n=1 Tax=Diabrotica virgifera virgifera TaxID=50390 RepID=A0A6P7GWK7_DIAVI